MIRLGILCIILISFHTISQTQTPIDVGFKLDVYPTGLIPAVIIDKAINEKEVFAIRLGYNWFRHGDLGVHDDERGGGFGYTIGYKRYLKADFRSWYFGIKSDMWWNHADWYDIGENDQRVTGETDITVLQPTVESGYVWLLDNGITINPSLSFGWEWNIRTEGEPTGQGAIVLAGIQIAKRFN